MQQQLVVKIHECESNRINYLFKNYVSIAYNNDDESHGHNNKTFLCVMSIIRIVYAHQYIFTVYNFCSTYKQCFTDTIAVYKV